MRENSKSAYNDEKTRAAWHAYIETEKPVPKTIPGVRQMIADSWRRSQTANAEKGALPRLADDEIARLLRNNALMAEIALPYLTEYYKLVDASGVQITLSDAHGYQLDKIGMADGTEALAQNGTDFSEASAGTNGIGTALALLEPVTIFGPEHFNPCYHKVVCYAAPIYNPAGGLIGAVNITGPLESYDPMMLSLLIMAIDGIEKQFDLTVKNNMMTAFIANAYNGSLHPAGDNRTPATAQQPPDREYETLTQALEASNGIAAQAAKSLSMPLSTFYRRIKKKNIRAKDFRHL